MAGAFPASDGSLYCFLVKISWILNVHKVLGEERTARTFYEFENV
jgi:hypothetical protein